MIKKKKVAKHAALTVLLCFYFVLLFLLLLLLFWFCLLLSCFVSILPSVYCWLLKGLCLQNLRRLICDQICWALVESCLVILATILIFVITSQCCIYSWDKANLLSRMSHKVCRQGSGMLVVSLRGVNFRSVWSRLGCCGQNTITFSRKSLF